MKKTIYESFIRCHILYGITIWGGASKISIKPLENMLSKAWSKIGGRRMHTLSRLNKFGILKFVDELRLQENKIVWKWENDKLPASLRYIIEQKVDNLRGRRFVIPRNSKKGNITQRLNQRANKEITLISSVKTKQSLTKKCKKEILTSYSFTCRQRNCFICGNRNQ